MNSRYFQQYIAYLISQLEEYRERVSSRGDFTQGQRNSTEIISLSFTLKAIENELHHIESEFSILADKEEGIIWRAGDYSE